jgi:hypothetical protein
VGSSPHGTKPSFSTSAHAITYSPLLNTAVFGLDTFAFGMK